MASITTIPVKKETRLILEPLKGKKTWDEFLLELIELKKEKMKEDLARLKKLINVDEIRRAKWAR